ncbi:hypothetical protein [Sphingobacterium pedocola]|nr:hypothetical protein [Sphingobacterium pedocola]
MSHRAFPTDLFAGHPGYYRFVQSITAHLPVKKRQSGHLDQGVFSALVHLVLLESRAGNKCQNYPSGWGLSGVHRLTLLAVNLLVKIKSGSSVVLQQGVMSGGVDVQGETFGREGSVIDSFEVDKLSLTDDIVCLVFLVASDVTPISVGSESICIPICCPVSTMEVVLQVRACP